MEKALVTGAGGFVGANLVRRLLHDGAEVHVFLRPESNRWRLESVLDDVHVHPVDLRDAECVQKAVESICPEFIYHLAVYGAYSFQTDTKTILETNIMGTANLVGACAKTDFEAFVNTGSSSEYGFKNHAPAEDELPEPNSDYAVSKVSTTLFCSYTSRKLERPITTLRLYSVYGAYEEPRRLMPTLIQFGLQGKLPPLVSPDTARDFIYVDDVSEAYIRTAHSKTLDYGEVLNVGSGIQTTLRDVVEVAREVMNIQQEPEWGSMEGRIWDSSVWVANNNRIRERLNWKPQVDFREGFARMVEWFREHQHYYAE
ncbi:MAG TPA: NAD-dependent epimerase/dehydratase family protein [Aggregatilineales bacterium]|nr:NAD-dependent epimerase/dehydratase family protein [Aggregatilineales bacterium]